MGIEQTVGMGLPPQPEAEPKIETEEALDYETLEPIMADVISSTIERGGYDKNSPDPKRLAADIISIYNTLNADERISADSFTAATLANIINDFCEELMRARYSAEKLFQDEMKSKMDAIKGMIDTMEPLDAPRPVRTNFADEFSYHEKRGIYFMGERVAECTVDQDVVLLDVHWDEEEMEKAFGKFLEKAQSI